MRCLWCQIPREKKSDWTFMTHTSEKPFGCKICGKRYTFSDTLSRDVIAAHEYGRIYQCEICAKICSQKSS